MAQKEMEFLAALMDDFDTGRGDGSGGDCWQICLPGNGTAADLLTWQWDGGRFAYLAMGQRQICLPGNGTADGGGGSLFGAGNASDELSTNYG